MIHAKKSLFDFHVGDFLFEIFASQIRNLLVITLRNCSLLTKQDAILVALLQINWVSSLFTEY
jgi:hypothetical protein